MTAVYDSEIEVMNARIEVMESEMTSYIDDLAEMTQRAQKAELQRDNLRRWCARIKATGEVV